VTLPHAGLLPRQAGSRAAAAGCHQAAHSAVPPGRARARHGWPSHACQQAGGQGRQTATARSAMRSWQCPS